MSPRTETLAVPVVPSTSSTAPRDGRHDGDRRHRDEHASQATHRETDQEGEEDDSRVQPEGAAGQVRRQPSLLDDLQDDTISSEQERGRHPTERKTGEQQDPGHEETADVRDESRREHEHGQRPGERHADQGQDDEAQHRIHGRDHGGPAHIAARSAHRLLAGVPDPIALPAAKPRESEIPCLFAVKKQVEGQEEAEHHDGPGFDEGIEDRRGLLGQPRLDLLDNPVQRHGRIGGQVRGGELGVQSLESKVEVLRQVDQKRDQGEGRSTEARRSRSGQRRRSIHRRPSRHPSRALAVAR